ncbi:hypothetical protein SDC9_147832 [bioreactor metagenome]|uniref:Uncharacterized protein n=1 Tax=bioreactor metagenome TaxID=1076179 RepID=A0A645EGR5_9ZZZZ
MEGSNQNIIFTFQFFYYLLSFFHRISKGHVLKAIRISGLPGRNMRCGHTYNSNPHTVFFKYFIWFKNTSTVFLIDIGNQHASFEGFSVSI